jgi:Na+/melibiose symporter-like transporter
VAILGYAGSIVAAAIIVAAFFAAYDIAYEPYRALYPDLIDDDIAGRAQSTQALFRGAATCLALVGGGLLISIGTPVPFFAAAGITAVSMAVFAWALIRRGIPAQQRRTAESVGDAPLSLRDCIAERRELRAFLVANALWELSLAALKTFVVLHITRGLGFSVSESALIIGAGAVVILLATRSAASSPTGSGAGGSCASGCTSTASARSSQPSRSRRCSSYWPSRSSPSAAA